MVLLFMCVKYHEYGFTNSSPFNTIYHWHLYKEFSKKLMGQIAFYCNSLNKNRKLFDCLYAVSLSDPEIARRYVPLDYQLVINPTRSTCLLSVNHEAIGLYHTLHQQGSSQWYNGWMNMLLVFLIINHWISAFEEWWMVHNHRFHCFLLLSIQ